MSKNVQPLILERNPKLINTTKPQKIAQNNDIINKENTPIISKAILKKIQKDYQKIKISKVQRKIQLKIINNNRKI